MKTTKTTLLSLVASFDYTLQDIEGGTLREQEVRLEPNCGRILRRMNDVEAALRAGVNKRCREDAHLMERAGKCRARAVSYFTRRGIPDFLPTPT